MPSRTLTCATGVPKRFPLSGNHLLVVEAVDPIDIHFYKFGAELIGDAAEGVRAGLESEPEKRFSERPGDFSPAFDYVEVVSSSDQTVQLHASAGRARNSRSQGSVDATIVGENKGSDTVVGKVTVTTASTQILAASSNRRKVSLFNNSPTDTLYISDGTATADSYPIPPLTEKVIEESPDAAINGISAESSIEVRYLVEEQS